MDSEDPMMPRTGIALTIAQARASLREPSRPYTPADAMHNRSLFVGQEYGSSRPTTGDCYNIGFRPETAAPTPRNQEPVSSTDQKHMYVAGGAEVFDVAAAQEAESHNQHCPTPPPRETKSRTKKRDPEGRTSKSRMSSTESSNSIPSKSETENETVAAVPTQEKQENKVSTSTMPRDVLVALEQLEPGLDPQLVLDGCQVLIDYCNTFQDFRAERPNDARAIQRKGFKLLESKHAGLQARLAKLALKVAGKLENVVSVTKLIFRLSKDEANDKLFQSEALIDEVSLLLEEGGARELPADGKIFVVGTIKNAALSETNRTHMIHAGTVSLLARLLEEFEKAGASGDRSAQLLVQITGALRNLSNASGDMQATVQHDMVATGVLERMAWILQTFAEHEELVLNIARTLHKLTLNVECREAIISVPHFVGGLLRTLVPHVNNLAIIVRVCFVLGNITASDGPSRGLIAGAGGVDLLGGILERYDLQDAEVHALPDDNPTKQKQLRDVADVLTKVIRVLANLAIDEAVGPQISKQRSVERVVEILERRRIDSSEELVLNAVSAVTNLSFYDVEGNVILEKQEVIGTRLQPLLLHENDEAVIESVRAYGNFSRAQEAKDRMVDAHVDEVMIMLLDHGNTEVVYSVCGVLMNLVADPKHKDVLGRMDGVSRLIKVIVRSGVTDVGLSVIACRALFNYCLDAEEDPLDDKQAEEIYETLQGMLQSNEDEGVDHPQWPELDEVATKLLGYIEDTDEGAEETVEPSQ